VINLQENDHFRLNNNPGLVLTFDARMGHANGNRPSMSVNGNFDLLVGGLQPGSVSGCVINDGARGPGTQKVRSIRLRIL
jgi:hypothetical protein